MAAGDLGHHLPHLPARRDGAGHRGQLLQIIFQVGLADGRQVGQRQVHPFAGGQHRRKKPGADGEIPPAPLCERGVGGISALAGLQLLDKPVQRGRRRLPRPVKLVQNASVIEVPHRLGQVHAIEPGHAAVAFDAHVQDRAAHALRQGRVQGLQELRRLLEHPGGGTQPVGQGGVVPPHVTADVQVSHLPHRVVFQGAQLRQREQLAFQEQLQQPVAELSLLVQQIPPHPSFGFAQDMPLRKGGWGDF